MAGRPDPDHPVADPFARTRFVLGDGPAFERVVFFTDAVYAIAMTLIVVSLDVPRLRPADEDTPRALLDALNDESTAILTFFVTFVVIGQFWIANHRFVGSLRAVDSTFILVNLGYLALVAFLPFPASVMADYSGNPVAVSLFAVVIATISTLEWVSLRHARRADLLQRPLDDAAYRWTSMSSLNPVIWFLLSIAIAFAVDPTVAMLSWLLAIPTAKLLERRRPASLDA